jgi:hypothetical protein
MRFGESPAGLAESVKQNSVSKANWPIPEVAVKWGAKKGLDKV